jgi:hypothetical protein
MAIRVLSRAWSTAKDPALSTICGTSSVGSPSHLTSQIVREQIRELMKSFLGFRKPCDGDDILRACAKKLTEARFFQLNSKVEYLPASCMELHVNLQYSLWDGHESERFVIYA